MYGKDHSGGANSGEAMADLLQTTSMKRHRRSIAHWGPVRLYRWLVVLTALTTALVGLYGIIR